MQNLNLKLPTIAIIIAIILNSCNQHNKSTNQVPALKENKEYDTLFYPPELNYLISLNGKYPYDVKLLDNPKLKPRLEKLMGNQYEFLKNIWQVETPIEITDTFFYTWGMQAHSGGDPGAVLMVNLLRNVLYVGVRKDKHVKIYSEDSSDVPKRLKDWSNETTN